MSKNARQIMHTADYEDPTRQFLARLFWRASTPLVAGLLLQACGNESGEPVESSGTLLDGSMHCEGERWRPMSALKLDEAVDFAALRTHSSSGHPWVSQRDAAGAPCAHASEPRLCEAEMRRVSVMETDDLHSHLLITQGDSVRAFKTLEQKLALLGAIDTPDEALLLVDHLGKPIGCRQEAGFEGTRVSLRDGGYRVVTRTPELCGNERTSYTVDVDLDGKVNIVEQKSLGRSGCTAGRRPPNLLASKSGGDRCHALGRYFARVAHLEAASVDAFEQLADELRILGAPRTLREAARRAAEDEVRHARDTGAFAERFGARPRAPVLTRRRLRGPAEVALDNALEGCVAETYSAYIATAQARLIAGTSLATPLARIADDETGHAALAWQIAAWLEPQLDPQVRRRIAQRRFRALTQLGARAA